MVGTRRKRPGSKSKALGVVPDEPEPLQFINAEAINGPSDDELEQVDVFDSEVGPVYDGGYDKEEQMTDEIYQAEVFEFNEIASNANEDVHTEDEEVEEDEEPVSGGSDNEEMHTEDEEEDEEVKEQNEDCEEEQEQEEEEEDEVEAQEENEEEPDEEEVEAQEENEELDEEDVEEQEEYGEEEEEEEEEEKEKDENLANYGSDDEDVHTFAEVRDDGTACLTNTNEGLTSPELVLVENLTDNQNDEKEANRLMLEEPISIPAENGGDKSTVEIASTVVEAKIGTEQDNQPKKKLIRRRLGKKNTALHGNEGSDVSCKAGTSNEANLLSLEDNKTVGVASKDGKNEKGTNEKKVVEKPIVKVNKKMNTIRKENQHGQSGAQTDSVEQKPKPTNNDPVSKENKTSEQEFTNEEAEKSEARFTRKQKNKRIMEEGTQIGHAKDTVEPESSEKGKSSKRVESQGMIFMCSSNTKKDCFRYKVFGLSAAKKDLVSKIYKGMRLFLFDVNLRMLYGIYKAAGRGSYDIEPRAFHSQFPSQVRFTILKDCLPIPEEKFKKCIKDNYFTKKKFDCQLNKHQVRNLCRLFNETAAKKSAFRQGGPSQKPRPIETSSPRVDRKRKRVEDSRRVERRPISSQDPGRRRRLPEQPRRSDRTRILRDQEEMRRPIVVRHREEVRLAPVIIDERYRHPAVIYDRDAAYLPSVESSVLYKPYRAEDSRAYSYDRSPRVDHYRRESALDYRDHEISRPRESRHYVQQTVHDPYTIYRESGVYHEPLYDSYPSPERRSSKYYKPSDEYRSPLTDRRRY